MEHLWTLLGVVVLGATLLDVFLTALNFDEAGFIAGPLSRLQWRVLRWFTRRLPRRWRPVGLRQVTGLQIVVVIIAWLSGVILGFGLIYYGQMSSTAFSVSGRGAGLTLFDALYFSAAQMATVGGSSLTAETDLLRFLSILETFVGVVLVSLILTFLLGVYSVIGDLKSLCRYFFTAERGAGSVVASLAPFFRGGQPSGLDGHLDGIAGSFSSYVDGLRLHHAAYYFQSGRDQFSLPYAVRMLAGTIAALRWGLPRGHPGATEPGLVPLTFQFLEFGEYVEQTVPLTRIAVPEVVSAEEFARLVRAGAGRQATDAWVARFVQLDAAMARLAGIEPLADLDDAYGRYRQWLPFAYRAEQVTLTLSEDLDYQPVLVSDRPVPVLGVGDAAPSGDRPSTEPPPSAGSRWRDFAERHLTHTDPGYARLRSAARALLSAAAAVVTLSVLFEVIGSSVVRPAIFGGFVAMVASGVAVGRTQGARRLASVLILVPVAVVVVLGALVSDSPLLTGLLVVLVASVGLWGARFGPRWAAIGRASFMAYYFALIMRLDLSEVGYYLAAAAIGVAWAYLLDHVILPERPGVVLRGGVEDFSRRLVASIDPLVDTVSWARWDPDVRRHVELAITQLHRHAAFLAGQLGLDESATQVPPERATALRLRLFDTQLAVMALVAAARDVTGTTISLELRARLAGRLEELRRHLAEVLDVTGEGSHTEAPQAPWPGGETPEDWPRPARALCRAADELYRVAATLHSTARAALDPSQPFDAPLSDEDGAVVPDDGAAPAAGTRGPATQRAVQAAVATAAALGIGEAVSSTHQYWATLPAYQVLGETDGETFVNGARRVAGTVVGAVAGFAIALSDAATLPVVLPLLALAVFCATYYRPVSPAISIFWRTLIFATLYEYLGRLTTIALELRVLETVLGTAAALVVAFLVLPTHTRAALDRDLGKLVGDVDVIVSATLSRLAHQPGLSLAAVRERILVAEQHVAKLATNAAPLRRSTGALTEGGVEARLTAVWSLVHHTRELVRETVHATEAGVPADAEDWQALGRATSENAAALRTALAGELPGPVDEEVCVVDGGGAGPAASHEDRVVREVARINQTLLLLLEDTSPGALGEDRPTEKVET